MVCCYVPGCRSGYYNRRSKHKINKSSHPPSFSPPKDETLRAEWQRMIPNADRPLTSRDRVCALHFPSTMVITHDEIRLSGGYIHRMPRERMKLRKNAVPTIFSNFPSQNLDTITDANRSTSQIECIRLEIPNILETIKLEEEEYSFSELISDVENLTMPELWSYTKMEHMGTARVALLKWSDLDLDNVEKKIVISNDLKVKIYLSGQELKAIEFHQIANVENVQNILTIVDKIKICETICN